MTNVQDVTRYKLELVPPPKHSRKVRPDIVKFVRYIFRRKIHIYKKLLNGTKVSITEILTVHRVAKLKEAKEKLGFKNVWSNDGGIIYKENEKMVMIKPKYILTEIVALFYGEKN